MVHEQTNINRAEFNIDVCYLPFCKHPFMIPSFLATTRSSGTISRHVGEAVNQNFTISLNQSLDSGQPQPVEPQRLRELREGAAL
jgi:hypothetical protein